MTILESLYNDYINGSKEYYEEQKNGEAAKSIERMNSIIRQVVYSPKDRMQLSDELGDVALAHEQQGFVHGFRQAMKMAAEIFATENMKMPD